MYVKDWRFRLEHIIEAINRIQSYTRNLTYEEFSRDHRTIDAVALNFAILGEAARHIPTEIKEKNPSIPWSAMSAMRNITIHDYSRIDVGIVWQTIWDDLPSLPPLLRAILKMESEE